MKKLFFIVALVLPLVFTSCKKDDAITTNEFVGLWELCKIYFPQEDRWYYAEKDIDELHEVEFYDDGSGQFNNYYKSHIDVAPFYWVVTDKQLRLVMGENVDSYEAYWLESINSKELIISNEEKTSYYKRVK